MNLKKILATAILTISALTTVYANLPQSEVSLSARASDLPNIFGGGESGIHFNPHRLHTRVESGAFGQGQINTTISENSNFHFNPQATGNIDNTTVRSSSNDRVRTSNSVSPFYEGQHIGTLHVERLNRTIRIFEGESMRNMDFGAGRFSFGGINTGNTSLIGHNRGRNNGFFDFVRLLQQGDILTVEMNGIIRTYAVAKEVIVHESDFSMLEHFGDNRLTLVTCLEYRQQYRRIAVALVADPSSS